MAKSEELQRQAQRVLAELGSSNKPLSARAAGHLFDIGYNQISDMLRGKTPSEKTLIRFANAINESPTNWLCYAGKLDPAKVPVDGIEEEKAEAERLAQQIMRDLALVPKERRSLLVQQIKALIKATADA